MRRSGALDKPGLFRGGGDTDRITSILSAFESGGGNVSLDALGATVEDVCTLLKMFLRSLENSVGTKERHGEWLAIPVGEGGEAEETRDLIRQLPRVHEEVMQYVVTFLLELLGHRERNGLTAQSLGVTFGPLLLRGGGDAAATEQQRAQVSQVVALMLLEYPSIFLGATLSDPLASSDSQSQATPPLSKRAGGARGSSRSKRRPVPAIPATDEFTSLAQLAVGVSAGPGGGREKHAKTPEDSEEDLPESSSDDDEVPRMAVIGRATVRQQRSGSSNRVSVVSGKPFEAPPAVTSDVSSLSSIDSLVLQEHINHLREMPLTPKGQRKEKHREVEDGEDDDEATRLAKLETIRRMLLADPRFKSQTHSTASAKYEPAAVVAKRKKSRRKPRRTEKGTPGTDGPNTASATSSAALSARDAPAPPVPLVPPLAIADSGTKKRRPRYCGKCKEVVRGVKVNALGQSWHPACFLCATCGKQLADFFECEQRPYCGDHIGAAEEAAWGLTNEKGEPLCGKCELVVDQGTIVSALGKRWHGACFVCERCACPLETYFGAGGKPFCEKHVAEATQAAAVAAAGMESKLKADVAVAGDGGHHRTAIDHAAELLKADGSSGSSGSRRKKKKKSHRVKRALSNPTPLSTDGVPIEEASSARCGDCGQDYSARPALQQHQCSQCMGTKCSDCGSWYRSPVDRDSPALFVCALCLPALAEADAAALASQKVAAAMQVVAVASTGTVPPPPAASSASILAPRRFPKKQETVLHYDKAKKRVAKRYAVLAEQRFCLYKDEAAARKAKDPLEILDMTLLRKVTKMGVHLDKPYCLALTVEYETTLVWVEMIEYGNWSDALIDSGVNVAIGAID